MNGIDLEKIELTRKISAELTDYKLELVANSVSAAPLNNDGVNAIKEHIATLTMLLQKLLTA